MRRVAMLLTAAVVLAVAAAARGADEESERARFEGEAKVGWRFVSESDEGRFPQDFGLQSGPRLFDLRVAGESLGAESPFEEVEFTAYGVGDRETDYRLRLAGENGLELEGGWSSDAYSYRATGDPYPYDTDREHGFFRARYAPSRDLGFRLSWDRRTRRGTAFVQTDTDIRGSTNPPPPGVDADIVSQRRPLDQVFDTFTAGVEGGSGPWSYGLTQTIDLARIDDERSYDVPAANRTGGPIRESLGRSVRSKAYTTVGKLATTLLDDTLDATLLASYTRMPLDTRISGATEGYDDFFDGTASLGQFEGAIDGGNRTERSATSMHGEVAWRAVDDVELVLSGELDEIIDDASLELTERRVYDRAGAAPRTLTRDVEARITDRGERWSAEVDWDATDTVRLRLGEEFYRQHITSPTDTHGGSLLPTVHRSRVQRHLLGVDWKPDADLSLSALARLGEDDRPHANASFENSDEMIFRGRYRPVDSLSLTAVYRYTGLRQKQDLDSRSNAESATVGAVWRDGPWNVSAQGGVHWHETHTQTTFFSGFVPTAGTVRYRNRDTVVSLDTRYDLTPTARVTFTGTFVHSTGTYSSEFHDVALGGEVDVEENLTLGAVVRSFRLDERDGGADADDGYDVEALEITLTYRF